ncbi:MAG: hypothetical protein ACR2PT_06965 [Endozoicomonas sp.]
MGSVQDRLISRLRTEKQREVIDLESVRAGREAAYEFEGEVSSIESLIKKGQDPLHAAYTYTQNFMSVLIEQSVELPELHDWADLYANLEEDYMPSGPPMSPLSRSYFWCWSTFDLTFGSARETMGQCIHTIAKEMGVTDDLLAGMKLMQESRMGLYVHNGFEGPFIKLQEIVTGEVVVIHCGSGYRGSSGQIWYVRLLPPLIDGLGYHVAFTSPYVIRDVSEAGLKSCILRMLPKMAKRGYSEGYEGLMKWGPSDKYWNEFIMMAYSNYAHDVIYLTGYPSAEPNALYQDINDLNSYQAGAAGNSDWITSSRHKSTTGKMVMPNDVKKKRKQAKDARKKNRK